jgi:uncharacterized protein
MKRDEALACLRAALPELRARYGVTRLGLFGSVARDEAREESDVDLVAEFGPAAKVGLFELQALERDLAARLGRPATIASLQHMNRYVRTSAERDLIYAE